MTNEKTEKSNREKLIEVVVSVKTALINTWKASGESFVDRNHMDTKGILAESIGLTGLLLLLVGFKDEPGIMEDSIDTIKYIFEKSLKEISDSIEKDGYSAAPLLAAKDSSSIFDKEKDGYIETITWVLSICILAHYAERKGVLEFNKNTQDKIIDLSANTLKRLLESQRDDGTWGFMASKDARKSLFFTYSVGSAYADVYDYIFGELKEDKYVDNNFAELLSEKIGVKDIKEKLDASREKLTKWLVENCLPLLPKLSNCENMDDNELKALGMWEQKMEEKKYGNMNYYNLYYVYYLIDLMINHKADEYYENIIKSDSAIKGLMAKYKEYPIFSSSPEERYFFKQGRQDQFLESYIKQALHSSRNHYLSALRTGNDFWDTTKSELTVKWLHSDTEKEYDIEGVFADERISAKFKEPAIVPMALRANINYSYFITQKPDVIVDDLFEFVKDSRFLNTSEEKKIEGLWDTLSYNLLITERSIEALVDYYDYLREYDRDTKKEDEFVVPVQQKESEIDGAIKNAMATFLASDEAKAIMEESLGGFKAVNENREIYAQPESIDDVINKLFNKVYRLNSEFNAREAKDADMLGQLFDELQQYSTMCKIGLELRANKKIDQSKLDLQIQKVYEDFYAGSKELLKVIINDINDSGKCPPFKEMYKYIIRSSR